MLKFKDHITEKKNYTVKAYRNKSGTFANLYSIDQDTMRKLKSPKSASMFYRKTQASRFGRRTNLFRMRKEDKQSIINKLIELQEIWNGSLSEAEYQGRDVPLNKPMAGDVKKSKVFVKNEQGNVVKVNFGDKNMTIKKNIPARRKSFRARHNCDTPGPKTKARYWSCKAW
jgi:hypothetical protein